MEHSSKRINLLLDHGSFVDHYPGADSHFVCGEGTIHTQRTFLIMNRGQDCDFQRDWQWNTLEKIIATITMAQEQGAPLIYIQDKLGKPGSGFNTAKALSSDMSTLLLSPTGMGRVSASLARFAESNLLISVILGPTSGPLALPLMLADLVLMAEQGALCMGRPDVVKAMLAQESELYSLGGSTVHSQESGLVQRVFDNEADLFRCIGTLFGHLFGGDACHDGKAPGTAGIAEIIPRNHSTPYDVRRLLHTFIDADSFTEISPDYAREVTTGFVRLAGKSTIVIANNSKYSAGVIHRRSAAKMVKMIGLAAKCNVPILFIADAPGFMIGKEAENSGVFAAAAELFKAHVKCHVPKLLLIARKAYTGGVYAMGGPGFDPVAVLAYPWANIGVYSADAMGKIISGSSLDDEARHIAATLSDEVSNPELLKRKGLITDVIDIEHTREQVTKYLFPLAARPA